MSLEDRASGRDLLVVQQTPCLGTGQALRVYTVSRALAASGTGLTLAYVRFGADEPDAAFRGIPGIQLHEIRASRGLRRGLLYARQRLSRTPRSWARGISPEIGTTVDDLISRTSPRRIIADGPVIGFALASLARRHPVIYNAHNLESSFRHELNDHGLGSPAATRAAERRLIARSAETWMVSERDVAGARELCPSAVIRYVPNVVDTDAIVPVAAPSGARRVLMVGNFRYEPNLNAARFVVERVMPRVWRDAPDTALVFVGRGLEDPAPTEDRVVVKGFVPDLAAEYADASCAVVPLFEGGGTPFKFIEALAYGVPVVATQRAAAGLAVTPGQHYLAADDEESFATAILGLQSVPGRAAADAMRREGRRIVEERYSIGALTRLVWP